MPELWDGVDPADVYAALDDLVAKPSWHADALCVEYPRAWWFPPGGGSQGPAREVCSRCAVTTECLAFALEQGRTLDGIWAGTSARERKRMLAVRAA